MAYFLDVKHAFKMYVRKMKGEFKTVFKDSIENQEQERYKLDKTDGDEKAKVMKLEVEEDSQGIVNFQVKISKHEKSILLLCFSHHNWNQPITNDKEERAWATLRIPLVTLKVEEDLPEKYTLRIIQFSLSSSAISRYYNNNWEKHTGKEWTLVSEMEQRATENIIAKKRVNIADGNRSRNEEQSRYRGDRSRQEESQGINATDIYNRSREEGNHRDNATGVKVVIRGHNEEFERRGENQLRDKDRTYVRGVNEQHEGNNTTIPRPLPTAPINLMDLQQKPAPREGYSNNRQPDVGYLTEREAQILQKARDLDFNCEVVQRTKEPIEKVYNHLKPQKIDNRRDDNQHDYFESRNNRSFKIRQPIEPQNATFRHDKPEPTRSTGNWETDLHKAKLLDVLPTMVSNKQRNRHYYTELEPKVPVYESMYTERGERQKQKKWFTIPDFDRNRSDEQWRTIDNVRSTIGGAGTVYEEPNTPKENKKESLQWIYKPLDRFLPREARAKTPVDTETDRVWTSEMAKNMEALALNGARPKETMLNQIRREKAEQQKQDEEQRRVDLMTQEQERKRVTIEIQMAQINKLNANINNQLSARESPENEDELLTYRNILCSTHPALVGGTYQSRLEIMSEVSDELEQTVRRKSRRLQKLQAAPNDLRGLTRRERGNLE